MWQHGPIDALTCHNIDLVERVELLRRESFGRAVGHVTCIVNQDVKAAFILGKDVRNGCSDGFVASDVEGDSAEVARLGFGEGGCVLFIRCNIAVWREDARVDDVAGTGKGAGCHGSETG